VGWRPVVPGPYGPGPRSYDARMCFSALVRNTLQWLERMYGAEAAWEVFEELFGRRLEDDGIKLSRGLEANFAQPTSPIQQRTKDHIDPYRARSITKWEQLRN
jgi:hypothetical protein